MGEVVKDDKKEEQKEDKKEEKKEEKKDEKPPEPQPITVVLKVKMHCQGCERKVKKSLSKLKGLMELKLEPKEHKVTVKGFVDPKEVLRRAQKTGKQAEFWPVPPPPPPPPPPKEEQSKKESTESPNESKSEEETKNKEEPKKEEVQKPEEKKVEEVKNKEEKKEDGKKKDEPVTLSNQPPMQFETVRIIAPQYFSDENPNACSVM